MARWCVLLMVLVSSMVRSQTTHTVLHVGNHTYSIERDVIMARATPSGRVVWKRRAPARAFRWLGVSADVLLGIGVEQKRDPAFSLPRAVEGQTVFGFNSKDGRERWRSRALDARDAQLLGRAVVYSFPDGTFAVTHTEVLDSKTGKLVLETTGTLAPRQPPWFAFRCVAGGVIYCFSSDTIRAELVNQNTLAVKRRTFLIPDGEACVYGSNYVLQALRFRYDAQYLEFILEYDCGRFVSARYGWRSVSNRPLVTRILERPAWPVSR